MVQRVASTTGADFFCLSRQPVPRRSGRMRTTILNIFVIIELQYIFTFNYFVFGSDFFAAPSAFFIAALMNATKIG